LQIVQPGQRVVQTNFASASHNYPHMLVLARQAQCPDSQAVIAVITGHIWSIWSNN
jgi:hypothetical protein